MGFAQVAIAALLFTATSARAENWGDNTDPITAAPEYAQSKAICRGLKRVAPPASDRPDRSALAALKGCRSEALYYGIGRRADPARARQCAFAERGSAEDGAGFAGDAMLMTIYANGIGAARNLDVAISLACQIGGAPAEQDGRVNHLAKLRAEHWTGTDFSFCDDVTSGFAMGVCASHDAALADAQRQQQFASVTAGWSEADKRAFAVLRKAEQAFVDARAGEEVDMSGTARAAMSIDEQQQQQTDFLAMLKSLTDGSAPSCTSEQLAAADTELNSAYRDVQHAKDPSRWGTVTKDGIRTTQRAWLRYRDAWVAFAAAKYPAVSPDAIRCWLTGKRTAMLRAFLG